MSFSRPNDDHNGADDNSGINKSRLYDNRNGNRNDNKNNIESNNDFDKTINLDCISTKLNIDYTEFPRDDHGSF